ncbi:MAG TPA: SurA N-terminal domain-containing protein [Deltaproteobacteria bacterium]|nr:SurA N-terminal domain-containing protein [Deltaproteobacteria bacterium]HQB37894.1 SurA N-terminal domain-containing protein [Deltaproteobacteria bacterium]
MLDFIRKKKQSVIIKIVFAVIILSFILAFGLSYMEGKRADKSYAAKVNGHKISLEEYRHSYERLRNIYMQIYGQGLPAEAEKALGIRKAALEQLIDNVLVSMEARKMGIKISKEELSDAIAAMPVFQKDGAFSFDLYQNLLKSNRITAKDFEEGQRSDMMITRARQMIRDKASVGDEEALARFKKENDRLEIDYVSFAPADVIAEVKPSDADLNEYLQKNQQDFKIPEKTAISYVLLDPAKHAAGVSVTAEEISTYYNKNIDRWQGKDGILPLDKVRDKVKAEALRQKAAKQAYEQAADTLFKHIKSGDLKPIAAQLKLPIQTSGLFTAKQPPQSLKDEQAVIKKAFELKQGELGGPVETSRGIYVILISERKEAVVPPLKDVRNEVEQRVKSAKAAELAKSRTEAALNTMKDKAPAGAKSAGPFGYNAKGDLPGIGSSPELMEAAFKLTPTLPAADKPVRLGNRWYAIRLKNRIEAPKSDFEKQKDQIKARMLPAKQQETITAWIKGLREKAKIDINQALIADR